MPRYQAAGRDARQTAMDSGDAGLQAAGTKGQVTPVVVASILPPDGWTGVHTHVREVRRFLAARGVASDLVTPYSWARPLTVPAFAPRLVLAKLHKASGVAWYYFAHEVFLRRALRRRLSDGEPVVIYAQGPREARAALRARRQKSQRVVMVVHYLTSQADEWVDKQMLAPGGAVFRRIRRIEAETLRQLDGIVYVSDAARRSVGSWLVVGDGVPSTVVPNFVAPFSGTPGGAPEADLVTVGSLEVAKNHTYLLEVLAEAKDLGHRYTLDIYGAGPEAARLVAQARRRDLTSQVRFLGFRPDLRASLARHRLYVHTSVRESQGIALIEAMAAGLPRLVGETGGVREVCDEESGARFWPLDDAAAAASLLVAFLEDPSACDRAARKARRAFADRFAATAVGPRLLEFFIETNRHPTATGHPWGPPGTRSLEGPLLAKLP